MSVIPTDGSVRAIGAYAFAGLGSLMSVSIPDCVTRIPCFPITTTAIERANNFQKSKPFSLCRMAQTF